VARAGQRGAKFERACTESARRRGIRIRSDRAIQIACLLQGNGMLEKPSNCAAGCAQKSGGEEADDDAE